MRISHWVSTTSHDDDDEIICLQQSQSIISHVHPVGARLADTIFFGAQCDQRMTCRAGRVLKVAPAQGKPFIPAIHLAGARSAEEV